MPTRRCLVKYSPIIAQYSCIFVCSRYLSLRMKVTVLTKNVIGVHPRICTVSRHGDPLMMSSISFGRSTLPKSLAIRRRRRCQRAHSNIVQRAISDAAEQYRHPFPGDRTDATYRSIVYDNGTRFRWYDV